MKRKLYLEGEMAEKFGSELIVNVDNVQDSLKVLQANFPEFRSYLISCAEKDIGFTIDVADKNIEKEEDLILPLREGDITITPIPAGSKSGGAKILAAIAIVAIMLTPGLREFFIYTTAAGTPALTIPGYIAASMALSLAMTGIQQLMAPDPAVDEAAPQSYLFNGSQQNVIEGDPVPILYGELRVPGRPISFGVVNNSRTYNSVTTSSSSSGNEGNAVPNYNGSPSGVENATQWENDINTVLSVTDQSNNINFVPSVGNKIER